jgi:hypothetical protein
MFCKEQVAQLRGVVDDIRERGGELYVVGSGSPEQAGVFAKEQELSFDLYVDPSLEAYRAAGLRRDAGATLHPRIFKNALRTFGSGFRQGRTQGDPWQQGGAFVIAPGGRLLFSQVSQVAGDHADPDGLIRALETLVD